jgi:hypothetical protein
MARLHLIAGDRSHARHLALMAWEGLSGYGLDFFPDDLAAASGRGIDPARVKTPGAPRHFMELLAEFTPQADQDELLTRITARTSQFFGAERGGLSGFPTT